jgi:hypothetical protein
MHSTCEEPKRRLVCSRAGVLPISDNGFVVQLQKTAGTAWQRSGGVGGFTQEMTLAGYYSGKQNNPQADYIQYLVSYPNGK